MISNWVLNASPLILLGKADLLKPLAPLAGTWLVPSAVLKEIAVRSPVEPFFRDLSASSQMLEINVAQIHSFVAAWDLGQGESEVITLALNRGETGVVLDDSQARKCAKVLEVPLIGTLGLILKARRENLIPSAKFAIEHLLSVGLYADPETIAALLKSIGEHPTH
jgi:predicted nucleic acid-binding protein